MKALSVSHQDRELSRNTLNKRSFLIGRSPSCDIVLRGKSIRSFHYLLEWFGTDSFNIDKGDWVLLDLSGGAASKKDEKSLSGEGVLLKNGKIHLSGFDFEIVEDEFAESDVRRGVLKRGLNQDLNRNKEITTLENMVFEVVQCRKDIDTIVMVRHIPLSSLHRPTVFCSLKNMAIQKNFGDASILIKNLGESESFTVSSRGVDLTSKLKKLNDQIAIQDNDFLQISTERDDFYIRLVAKAEVGFDKWAWLRDPMLRTFLGVTAAIILMAFAMEFSSHEEEKAPEPPPRIATVEVKEVAPPPRPEPVKPPAQPPPEAIKEPPKKQKVVAPVEKATTAKAVAAAPVVKNSTKTKIGLNSPAPVKNVNSVGLLGALGGGKKSREKVSADMVLNQGIVSETVSGAEGFAVAKPPSGEIGVGKNGGSRNEGPGLVAAGTTMQNSKPGNLKSTGSLGLGDNEKFSVGQGLSGKAGVSGSKKHSDSSGAGDGEQEVTGGLDKEAVRRALAENKRAIRNCYEIALISKKDLQGKMILKWKINPEGSVERMGLISSALDMPSFENCVQHVVQGITFPKAPNKMPTTVIYPFVFQGKK